MKFYEFINQMTNEELAFNENYLLHCDNLRRYKYMYEKYSKAVEETCSKLGITVFTENVVKISKIIKKYEDEILKLTAQKNDAFFKGKIQKQIDLLERKINFANIGLQYALWQDRAIKGCRAEVVDIHLIEKNAVIKILTENFDCPLVQEVLKSFKSPKNENNDESCLNKYSDGKRFASIAIKYLKEIVDGKENDENKSFSFQDEEQLLVEEENEV